MSGRPAPLRPLVLTWAAFAVVPWVAVESLQFELIRVPLWTLAGAALVLAGWAVQSRTPVGWPRLATGAAGAMFVLTAVRLVALPAALPPADGLSPEEAGRVVSAAWLGLTLLQAAFAFASGLLASVCGEALLRRR